MKLTRLVLGFALAIAAATCGRAADVKITDLPAASSISRNEVFGFDQPNGLGGYTTVRAPLSTLFGALPPPSVSTRGAVYSGSATTNNFLTGIDTNGTPIFARPACGNLSNASASCSTDATNAANISSGTLPIGRLPAFSGAVTTSAGSNVTTLGAGVVGASNLAAGAAASNIGNAGVTAAMLAPGSAAANLGSGTTAALISGNNLSDLSSVSTARTNLGLGTAALAASTSFLNVSNNLSDLGSAATARTNLGLGTAATSAASSFLAVANNLSDLSSSATARTNLGLGSLATLSSVGYTNISSGAIATASQFVNNTASVVNTPNAIWSSAAPVTLTDGATITPDLSTGSNFTVTLGGNRTLAAPSNPKAGQTGSIQIVQDATGTRTLAFNSAYKWQSATACVLSTTANKIDYVFYYVFSSTVIVANCMLDVH